MSISSGHWEFSYKDADMLMSDEDLDKYQLKLLEIRDRYKDKVELTPTRLKRLTSVLFGHRNLVSRMEFSNCIGSEE